MWRVTTWHVFWSSLSWTPVCSLNSFACGFFLCLFLGGVSSFYHRCSSVPIFSSVNDSISLLCKEKAHRVFPKSIQRIEQKKSSKHTPRHWGSPRCFQFEWTKHRWHTCRLRIVSDQGNRDTKKSTVNHRWLNSMNVKMGGDSSQNVGVETTKHIWNHWVFVISNLKHPIVGHCINLVQAEVTTRFKTTT